MKIKAIDAECKDGMVAVELAFITSCKQLSAHTPETGRVMSSVSNSTSVRFAASSSPNSHVAMPSYVQLGAR